MKSSKQIQKIGSFVAVSAAFLLLSIAFWVNTDTATAAAGINQQMNFQGRLYSNDGAVIPDGDYNMEFKIVSGGTGCTPASTFPCSGTVEWTETRTGSNKVTVRNGYFSVELGSVNALSANIWNDDTLWLSMNIGGTGSPSWDGEMQPLKRLSASPYAFNASRLGGMTAANFLQLAQGVQTDSSTTNASIAVNKTGSTAAILDLQRAGSSVLKVNNNGSTLLQNASDSTSAFQIQNTDNDSVFTVDTENNRVGVGTATPTRTLDVAVNDNATNAMQLLVQQAGSGDVGLEVKNVSQSYYIGIDSSDSNTFKISSSTAAGGQDSMGNTTVSGSPDTGITNVVSFTKAVAPITGTVSTMRVYINSSGAGNTKVQAAIYNNSGSNPTGTALAVSDEVNATVGSNWMTFTFSSPVSVTAGTTYWLAYTSNGENNAYSTSSATYDGAYKAASYSTGSFTNATSGTTITLARKMMYAVIDSGSTPSDNFSGSLFSLTTSGAATFQNATNTTNAFQIQNATGSSIFTADTANERVQVAANNSTTNGMQLLVQQAGSGDVGLEVKNSSQSYYVGIDSSDGNVFKISSSAAAGNQVAMGNTSAAGSPDSGITNTAAVLKTVAPISGEVSTLKAYINGSGTGSNKVQMAIYANSSGAPTGNALAVSDEVAAPSGSNWLTFTLPAALNVTAGTTYWLAYTSNGENNVHYTPGVLGDSGYKTSTYTTGSFPNMSSGFNSTAAQLQLYANIDSDGTGDNLNTSLFQLTNTGAASFRNSTNSSNAFQVQNAAGTNILSIDTATGANLLPNASFENSLSGITTFGGVTVAQNATYKYSGTNSLQINHTNTNPSGIRIPAPLASSTTYTISFYVRTAAAGGTANLLVNYSPDGTTGSEAYIYGFQLNNDSVGGWQRFSGTFTTSTISGSPYITLKYAGSGGFSEPYYIDAIQLETGSAASAFGEGSISLNGRLSSPLAVRTSDASAAALQITNASNTATFTYDSIRNQLSLTGAGANGSGAILSLGTGGSLYQRTNELLAINTRLAIAGNSGNDHFGSASLGVSSGSSGQIAQIIRAVTGQSADLLQIQDGDSNVLAKFTSTGALDLSGSHSLVLSTGNGGSAIQAPDNDGTIRMTVRGNPNVISISDEAFTTGLPVRVYNANSNATAPFGVLVNFTAEDITHAASYGLRVQNNNGTTTFNVNPHGSTTVTNYAATDVSLTLKGATSQSADMLQIQNSSADNLFKVSAGGDLTVAGWGNFGEYVDINSLASSDKQIRLGEIGPSSEAGLLIGGDTALYRLDAGVLQLDGTLGVGHIYSGGLTVSAGASFWGEAITITEDAGPDAQPGIVFDGAAIWGDSALGALVSRDQLQVGYWTNRFGGFGANGSLAFANESNSRRVILQGSTPTGTGDATISFPTVAGGSSDTICLENLGNCGGGDAYLANNQTFTGTNTFSNTSAAAFKIQNASSDVMFNVDTTSGLVTVTSSLQAADVTLGTPNMSDGSLIFNNSNNSNKVILQAFAGSGFGDATILIPEILAGDTDTVCLEVLGNCGGGGASAATLAGAGLVDNGSSIDIGAGTGITVGANAISINQGAALTWSVGQTFSSGLTLSGGNFTIGGDAFNDLTGNGLRISSNALTIALTSATDGLSSTTSSSSGLEVLSGGLTLLQGCSDGQVLAWSESSDVWGCTSADLDTLYSRDSDKTLTINNTSGLTFNMTTTGDFTVQDNGTTVFQVSDDGTALFKSSTNSSSALTIQNSTSKNIFSVDTSGNQALFGHAGSGGVVGKATFNNGTNTNTASIQSGTTSSSYALTLPTALPGSSQCLQSSNTGVMSWTSCGGGGGGFGTLTDSYQAGASQFDSTIVLDSYRAGVLIQDGISPIDDTLFAIQAYGATATYLGVTANEITMQNASGNNVVVVDLNNSIVQVFEANGSGNNAQIYYASGEAVFAASSGTTRVGAGSGNITMSLTGNADVFTFNKTSTPSGTYSATDYKITRTLTGGSNALQGSVLKVEDLSSFSGGSSSPDMVVINQNNSSATGNLINGQQAGSSKFTVSTAGTVTIASGQSYTGAGALTLDSASGSALSIGTGANAHNITVGNSTGSTALTFNSGSGGISFTSTSGNITIGASDSTGTLVVLDTDSDATFSDGTASNSATAVNGAMFYSSTNHSFMCGVAGSWQTCNGLLYSNTSASSAIASCTNGCAAFNKAIPIPANYCQAGRTIRISARGIWGTHTSGTNNVSMNVYYGTDGTTRGSANNVQIGTANTTPTLTNNLTNQGWNFEYTIICFDTTHMSGQGILTYSNNASANTAGSVVMQTQTSTTGTSVTSNTAKNLYIFPTFNGSQALNTATLIQLIAIGN